MTMVKHHINDELLMGYAAGSLPEAFDLVVATHVSLSDDARGRLASFEALGGALLEEVDATPLAEDSFAETMARIREGDMRPIQRPARPRAAGVFPKPLQDYVGGDLADVKWKSVGLGVKQCILGTAKDGATARLLLIPAGQAMPDHGHNGLEATLVLQGAFIDDSGRFARGDIEVADVETEHMPVADIGEDCICLVATDAPLKFNSFLPKIAQRILRI